MQHIPYRGARLPAKSLAINAKNKVETQDVWYPACSVRSDLPLSERKLNGQDLTAPIRVPAVCLVAETGTQLCDLWFSLPGWNCGCPRSSDRTRQRTAYVWGAPSKPAQSAKYI